MRMESTKKRTAILLAVLGLAGILVIAAGPGAQADKQFTDRSIQGTYGFSVSGTSGDVGAVVVGLFTFDGKGGCTIKEDVNAAPPIGFVASRTSTSCTYKVNPDGTGTQIAVFGDPIPETLDISFVIVGNGDEIKFISTNPGLIFSGTARKQVSK